MGCWTLHGGGSGMLKEWPLYRDVRAASIPPWPCPRGSRGRGHNGVGEEGADRFSYRLIA